ncbi:hypothetical protein O181_025045 [Austropuccinia psidii MF-1]|uniref:Reverse transcriptase/retrotransposon-derived protein RNase H-like domain-containing protein n=1 Tax=Austropuccinia psidii MF-1 TaxID=1389203 RepID=A0A9Q3CLP1_9BASI|nr:hypothetical protein [Austropuccinia psidii MF-1]
MSVVPSAYHQYLDVFSKVKAEKLPPHCACKHNVKMEGYLPPVGGIYSSSNQASDILRTYISENLEEGFIRPSSPSTGAPVLFVKKKDGFLHLCVDYHKLNSVNRKNNYPVPPMNQLLTVFNCSSIFSEIDLHGAYNLLRIKEFNEHLTCFRTQYGSYEYLGMPFGLTNSPASFQNLFNDIFYYLLDIYVVASRWTKKKSRNFSIGHLQEISRLFNLSLPLPTFTNVSSRTIPLTEEFIRQFHQLKEAFITASILSHFTPSLPPIFKTDASYYVLAAVLSHVSDSGKPPIAFYSHTLLPEELNYDINDKELRGMVWALKHWRAFLLSLSSSFEVLTNHSSLQYFMSSKILTFHQACWAEFVSEFHFSITYFPGRLATLQDALSHRDNVYPERREAFISKNTMTYQKIIKKDQIQASKFFALKVDSVSNLIDSIQKALWQDSQYKILLQDLGKGDSVQDYSVYSTSQVLLFKYLVVVPNDPTIQLRILQKRTESPLAGRPGHEKTLKFIKKGFSLVQHDSIYQGLFLIL